MDLYEVLGVSPSASIADIKRQYKKLANKHHPDKPTGDAAKFKAIKLAYETLSNKATRKVYDETGSTDQQAANNLVITAVMSLFNEVFENDYIHGNYVKEARAINRRQTASFTMQITNLSAKIKKLEQKVDAVEVEDGENLVNILLNEKISNLKEKVKEAEFHREITKKTDKLLKGYNDVDIEIAGVELLDDK